MEVVDPHYTVKEFKSVRELYASVLKLIELQGATPEIIQSEIYTLPPFGVQYVEILKETKSISIIKLEVNPEIFSLALRITINNVDFGFKPVFYDATQDISYVATNIFTNNCLIIDCKKNPCNFLEIGTGSNQNLNFIVTQSFR